MRKVRVKASRKNMVRAPSVDKNGLKKGAWSEEEDNKLRDYVQRYGHWNWRQLPRFAGLARCGKSCRLRWMNYLKPGVRRGNYTQEEDELILKLYQEFGSRWALIASKLSGRTDNEIKNHWHTNLRRRVKQERKSMNAAGETSAVNNNYNHGDYFSNNSMATLDSSDEVIDAYEGTAGNVNQDEVSSFYYDPAAALIDDIGALDWAVLAESLSPFGEDFWSHDPFSFDASNGYTNMIDTFLQQQHQQLPPLMEQEGDEFLCVNMEEDDIILLHELLR